ncbi:hypothetical protein G7085_16010 [Tessaracoccus sp. HDW20]|uniref:hypothetical protein n=1 Tax=Tessaracoccus coleopterorum TaxID=2714950 RepID=UPI0018D49817|nr:hypothetical protein [Tessaracoccus coleopterorum]NHB85594.1 hypothetical protein [Tessaracoccus coleopterorum]
MIATDVAARPAWFSGTYYRADLTNYGEAVEVLHDADAVIHLANIPPTGSTPTH